MPLNLPTLDHCSVCGQTMHGLCEEEGKGEESDAVYDTEHEEMCYSPRRGSEICG